ncbi:serine hydrolase domain-containing protein [Herpetosiphon llansteffanensis]|uniref:serine hydrolase domain-containing protein n=1 Tax=Herpetosiphon llansteffanensis TaxID=2094568 RepID=UPI000D7C4129|nr:serine hydrolase domain-containing protein [Herpetosiphon llansteffanensis]
MNRFSVFSRPLMTVIVLSLLLAIPTRAPEPALATTFQGVIPISGPAVPTLTSFDTAVVTFMEQNGIDAASLAITYNGVTVFVRGYGWLTKDRSVLMPPNALMRLASITKPITAATIRTLVRAGLLSYQSKVFCIGSNSSPNCLLSIPPLPGETPDARLDDITIQHLLDHRGGWDRDLTFDPLSEHIAIAAEMGVPSPPTKTQLVQYMHGWPLNYTPGSTYAYSNYGYMLLGMVIEKLMGTSYTEYIQRSIFLPLDIPATEIELGRTLPQYRNPREPWYDYPYMCPNVFNPTESVLCPDGGLYMEGRDANGGIIATSCAYARFLNAYWIDGQPKQPGINRGRYNHTGRHPGVRTLARQWSNDDSFVIMFNSDINGTGNQIDIAGFRSTMDTIYAQVSSWPTAASPVCPTEDLQPNKTFLPMSRK